MNWHILGGGAIGSLWASRLSQTQTPYVIEHRTPLRERCLTLQHPNGCHQQSIIQPISADTINHPIDALLITTKSQQTLQAIQSVLPHIHPKTIIVLLQNGMGNQQQLQQQFPNNPLYAGVCTDGVWRHANSRNFVTIAAYGSTTIGPLNSHASNALLQKYLPYKIQWQDDIWPVLWEKLAINCAINGLTAIHQCRNGELLNIAGVKPQIHSILKEVAAISRANGCDMPLDDFIDSVNLVINKTQHNYSSMYQDIAANKTTEIQAINGYICREGIKHHIATPANRAIEQSIIQLEHKPTTIQ